MKHLNRVFNSSLLILALNISALPQSSQGGPSAPSPILIEPVATYGNVSWEVEKKHLGSLADVLAQDPNLIGYIVAYAGRRACAGEAQARALRAKRYLVGLGVDASRVVWTDAGHLDRPRIQLETQLRGRARYNYQRPEPLPKGEVQVLNCRGLSGQRAKNGK